MSATRIISCPLIAQFTHEFKRQHVDVSLWTLNLFLSYYLNRSKTLTVQDTQSLNSNTTSLQATVDAAVNAAIARYSSTLAAAAAPVKPSSNRSTLTAPSNRSVAAPKPLRTQRPPFKPPGTSYCWYHGTCNHSGSVCNKMEALPFTDAHRTATSAISINGQKGSEFSFNK